MSQPTVHPTPTPELLEWLKAYKGNTSFYHSLYKQWLERGWLSALQQTRIGEAMEREIQARPDHKPFQPKEFVNPTYPNGTAVEVKKWLAERIAKDMGLEVAYRNIEILQTFNESAKAVQIQFKLSPKAGRRCSVCGNALDTDISRATGIGPVCAKRLHIARYTKGSAQEILKEIETRINALPSYGPLWVPRSQIKGIVGAEVAGEDHWSDNDEQE